MKKLIISVPSGVRYISEWDDFSMPDYPCIIDKKVPGCGFTEYCIRNQENVILCSPRKLLIENKRKQHSGEIFGVKIATEQDESIDKDLEKLNRSSGRSPSKRESQFTPEQMVEIFRKLESDLQGYINYRVSCGLPIKILVTYDSFKFIKDFIKNNLDLSSFRVIVDEFQSIFTDSRFKPSTELEFMQHLQDIQKVCYVSATPMIEDYLDMIDEFKELPYLELDWSGLDPFRVSKPKLIPRHCNSISNKSSEIIEKYLKGEFESALDYRGNLVFSKEAVFYVNSVTNIINIVKKSNLTPEQCNIIIADTPDNQVKLRKRLGKSWMIGEPPEKGKPHKMFTFCTRTVYLGVDFYSTNARTFIFSDANIETLAVDINLDLPQILGRQRNDDNPWKNSADFFFRTNTTDVSKEEFDKYLALKLEKTYDLLRGFSQVDDKAKVTISEKYLRDAIASNYKYDFVGLNCHNGRTPVPCLNKLVYISEKRGFDIQQVDYVDRFSVFNSIHSAGLVNGNVYSRANEVISTVNSLQNIEEKIKYICKLNMSQTELSYVLDQVPKKCRELYQVLGPDRCRALGYKIERMYPELERCRLTGSIGSKLDDIREEIYKVFQEGECYSYQDIKSTLGGIYSAVGYSKSPVATELGNYFEIKVTNVTDKASKKRVKGFKLINKKL